MSFAPRRRAARALAALLALVVLALPLAGTALASTSSITSSDCAQGTIRDKAGKPIPRSRCMKLVGKQVQLASTGFTVWPLVVGGVACLAVAAAVGLPRRGSTRPL